MRSLFSYIANIFRAIGRLCTSTPVNYNSYIPSAPDKQYTTITTIKYDAYINSGDPAWLPAFKKTYDEFIDTKVTPLPDKDHDIIRFEGEGGPVRD